MQKSVLQWPGATTATAFAPLTGTTACNVRTDDSFVHLPHATNPKSMLQLEHDADIGVTLMWAPLDPALWRC